MGKDLQDAFMAKIPNAVLGQVCSRPPQSSTPRNHASRINEMPVS
jgi:hypothetical protein